MPKSRIERAAKMLSAGNHFEIQPTLICARSATPVCLRSSFLALRMEAIMTGSRWFAALAGLLLLLTPARGEDVLRIAMTASDIPTATGAPNNGLEGYRFLGFPIFEGLVLWDLTRADRVAGLRPGLAETYEQAADDKRTWIFHLRHGVKFHDGTDLNPRAMS